MMMATAGSLHLSHEFGICKNHQGNKRLGNVIGSGKFQLSGTNFSSPAWRQDSWSISFPKRVLRPIQSIPRRPSVCECCSFINPFQPLKISCMKDAAFKLTRSCNGLQSSPLVHQLIPAIAILIFALWGIGPLMRQSRNIFLHKNDNSWRKSSTHYVMTSYLQPLLLWIGATLVCRALDPVVLPSEASQIVKHRLLNFVRSLSTVLAFACTLSSVIQQAQKFFMETNDPADTRNMGFQFAGKAVYTAVWVAAASLFMELLGFSTQRWLTAGGLGTVLLTLAGREIFTNFLSSAMIHATRPFVVNEWIQTKIEGYEVSGTVEHVGWWSPTIVRGENREAVHIPNHKFTVNVVRNLSQKTHWRIKTHLAISHLDVNKINNIVADMRKVLAKNPQVEQQKLHRRVFLDNVDRENQALLILVSCFVKTSHFEEYLCVKETVLLDLLRVIRHHRARLATPIRTVQKIISDLDLENIPFAEPPINGGAASNRPLLLIEPPYKIHGEERKKSQTRSVRAIGEQDVRTANKGDGKTGMVVQSDSKTKENQSSETKAKEISKTEAKIEGLLNPTAKQDRKFASDLKFEASASDGNPKISTSKQTKKPENGGEKSGSSQLKRDQKSSLTQPPNQKPAVEENIVLGVALEGSKRTLPIEEGMLSPSTLAEKELASHCSNGLLSAEKDKKKDSPNSNGHSSSSSGEQRDQ